MINQRDQQFLNLRPELSQLITHTNLSSQESFQNHTLRPIIKLQHKVLMHILLDFIMSFNKSFFENSLEEREKFVRTNLAKNSRLRTLTCGIVIGLFTEKELLHYHGNASEFNKRILQIITQRAICSLHELEELNKNISA